MKDNLPIRPRGTQSPLLMNVEEALRRNEEYEKQVMECNGYKFHPMMFTCPNCGAINDCTFTWKESNRSIQQRCVCGKWVGCVKYDPRPLSEKIAEPVYNQNEYEQEIYF